MWDSNPLSALLLAMLLWLLFSSLLLAFSFGLWWLCGGVMRLCMSASGRCWRRGRVEIAKRRFRWRAYWLRRRMAIALLELELRGA